MAHTGDFTNMVPGFDFLQSLMKNAGAAIPGMGQWIAPTLDPEELEKRIEELRTVQFWLEQNARMLGATIQALEVQRMTLSTLKTMNMPVADMADAFKIRPQSAAAQAAPKPAAASAAKPAAPRNEPPAPAAQSSHSSPTGADPMQWWGALTKQFTELAAKTMKETMPEALRAAAPATRKATGGTGPAAAKKPTAKPAKRGTRATPRTKGAQ